MKAEKLISKKDALEAIETAKKSIRDKYAKMFSQTSQKIIEDGIVKVCEDGDSFVSEETAKIAVISAVNEERKKILEEYPCKFDAKDSGKKKLKIKIKIKNKRGDVLFEYEKENNTIKDTVEEAVKRGISLENSDLGGAWLYFADLSGANLENANLKDANFSFANLKDANLSKANLSNANIKYADLNNVNLNFSYLFDADLSNSDLRLSKLCFANIENANLEDANLENSILYCAKLENANLENSILYCASLRCANLIGANLRCADIRYADLGWANLNGADIYGANLYEADLKNAINSPNIPMGLPDGEFIGWKKLSNDIIAKLKILSDSKRSRATSDKCRCDKALVLEFQHKDGREYPITEYTNRKYAECTYRVGEIVYADAWDEDRWNECSHGIHFFLDRQTAVDYKKNVR